MRRALMGAALLAFLAIPLAAQQAAQTVCKDGSLTASAGRGTCAGHGGVDGKATSAAKAKADAAARAAEKKVAARPAPAPPAAATVTCSDGSMSAGGRGACSGHGGVKRAAAAAPVTPPVAAAPTRTAAVPRTAPPVSAPAPATRAAPATPTGTGGVSAANATAKCNDGTYSASQHHRGACSRHGGVAQWLKQVAP